MRLDPGQYDSFTVRIWSHASGDLTHGQIVHVPSRRSTYFKSPRAMLAFMLVHLRERRDRSGPNGQFPADEV